MRPKPRKTVLEGRGEPKLPKLSRPKKSEGERDTPLAAPIEGVRIATLDIETSPLESYTWGIWEQNVGLKMSKPGCWILSFGGKGRGEKVDFHCAGGRGAHKVRDARPLMGDLW